MAVLAVAALGGAVGFGLTGTAIGLSIGWAVGSYLGSQLFPTQLPDVEGPRVTDLTASTSSYGLTRTRGYGTIGVAGNLIWSAPLTEHRQTDTVGGKGGGGSSQKVRTYSYTVSCAWALCEGPVSAVRRIWFDTELVWDSRETNTGISVKEGVNLRVYRGIEEQGQDSTIAEIEGLDNTPAYRGTCYIVTKDLDLTPWGNRRPSVRAEVVIEATGTNPAQSFAAVGFNSLHTDRASYWTSVTDLVGDDIGIYDIATNTLIASWPLPSLGVGSVETCGFHNGIIYAIGWVDNNDIRYISYDAITGEQLWISGDYASAAFVPQDSTTMAHKEFMTSGGFLGSGFFIFEYGDDGSLIPVFSTSDGPTSCEYYGSQVEPDTGYVWMLVDDVSKPTLYLVKLDLNPDYVAGISAVKYITSYQKVDLKQCFDSNGEYIGTGGAAADNFYDVRFMLAYDPSTQSIIIHQFTDGSGTYLPEGIYRLECTTRHDLSTLRIAASRTDIVTTQNNETLNIGNTPLGDGIVYYESNGDRLFLLNALDLATVDVIDWSGSIPNLLAYNTPQGDWQSRGLIQGVNSNGAWKLQWDRWPATGQTLDIVVADICTRHGLAAEEIDVTDLATKTVNGFTLSRPVKARAQIESLMGAYFFEAVETDQKLVFQLKDNASLTTITEDELAAHEPGQQLPDAVLLKRKELYQLPQTVQVTCVSRELEYEPTSQYSRQPTSPTEDLLKLEFPLVFTDDEAAQIAEKWMQSIRAERHTGTIVLGPKYLQYNPGDIVTVQNNGVSYQFRLLKTAMGGLPGLIKAEVSTYDAQAYDSQAVGAAPIGFYSATLNQAPISAFFMVWAPPLRDSEDDGGFYAAFAPYSIPDTWKGATLYRRPLDGDTWTELATGLSRALVVNEAAGAILPEGENATTWDWVNTINVRVWNSDTLATETELDVLNGLNALFFPVSGELLQFQVATLEGDGTYTLSGLLRGRRGTDFGMDDHVTGEVAIMLDAGRLYRVQDSAANYLTTFQYAAVTLESTLERARKENWTSQGSFIKPLSPVGLEASRNAVNNDLELSWIRRARLNAQWLDLVDVPLDEPTEEYDVELYQGADLLRTERVIGASSFVYTAAMQSTDTGGDLAGDFNFCVYQISSRVGRGWGACLETIIEPVATNFDEYLVNEVPANWQIIQPAYQTWEILDAGGGDLYVNHNHAGHGWSMLNWKRTKVHRDVEVLVKSRQWLETTFSGDAIYGVQVRSDATLYNGYLAGFWNDTGTAVLCAPSGSGNAYSWVLNVPTKKQASNEWWWTRLQCVGNEIKAKFWKDGTGEPAGWDIEITDTTFPDAGFSGLRGHYHYWAGPTQWDFFSQAYDGHPAPNTV